MRKRRTVWKYTGQIMPVFSYGFSRNILAGGMVCQLNYIHRRTATFWQGLMSVSIKKLSNIVLESFSHDSKGNRTPDSSVRG